MLELNKTYNMDCMDGMKQFPDKYFDLAIVDPPYGIDVNKMNLGSGKYKTNKKWDECIPDENYFKELFRVSKNQIVFGANYFAKYLPSKMGWIYWDKLNGTSDFSDGELAFSSFDRALRSFKYSLSQQKKFDIKNRFHPTQKPVELYTWLLNNYAKKGDVILDTHLGSASSIIACKKLGFEYIGFELDEDYFKSANKRIEDFTAQENMFSILNNEIKIEQESLF